MGASVRRELERHRIAGLPLESFTFCSEHEAQKWDKEILQSLEENPFKQVSNTGRRLNNFCLGSDPEFIFLASGERRKMNASNLGLKPGLAVGCDQNQRLAELRGWPTTSAVVHVAGILSSLRWMVRKYPSVLGYAWRAGAFYDGDGIGGHVHFGRKRPNRDREVAALDGLATLFQQMELFNVKEWEQRRLPDAHNNRGYGKFGDIRRQAHGYEYRTLPSWLCSPEKAFVILTTSKLTVLDPDLTPSWFTNNVTFDQGYELLGRMARYFAGRDDDAWILKTLLAKKSFKDYMKSWRNTPRDFKTAWGIDPRSGTLADSAIMPAVIEPAKEEVAEVQALLTETKPLTFALHTPTFRASLPGQYYSLIEQGIRGLNYAGAGDLAHNLVGHQDVPVHLMVDRQMVLGYEFERRWTPKQRELARRFFPEITFSADFYGYTLIINRNLLTLEGLPKMRQFLLESDLFPLWTVSSVTEQSLSEFKKRNPQFFPKASAPLKPRERQI